MKLLLFIMLSILSASNRILTYHQLADQIGAPSLYYSLFTAKEDIKSFSTGYADLERKKGVDDQIEYALFSITKTFTATAILQLRDQGLLSLDDEVSTYVTELDFLNGITLRHLMSHQSGLNNPLPLEWIHLVSEDAGFDYSVAERNILRKHTKIKRPPGVKTSYSNLNYLLLGLVIESVSGMDYQEYIRKNILGNHCGIKFTWDSKRAATGYHRAGFPYLMLKLLMDHKKYMGSKTEGYYNFKPVYLNGSAYGGLIASPAELKKYLQRIIERDTTLLSEQGWEDMFEVQKSANGKPGKMTLGWFTGELQGHAYVAHAGGGGGFYSEIRIYPEKGIGSIILTNLSGFTDKRWLNRFDEIYFNEQRND